MIGTFRPFLSAVLLAVVLLPAAARADEPAAFTLFSGDGKAISWEDALEMMYDADVVFFGEQHDNPIAHWLQLRTARALHARFGDSLTLGGEFFEADNQLLLDEYLNGAISRSSFESEVRLWPNYATDYRAILEFAKESGIGFVATNIPRRYASAVYRKGLATLDSLPEEAKRYIAMLPIVVDTTLESYRALSGMTHGADGGTGFIHAQAVKDATMGHFIAGSLAPGRHFLHINGAYHSDLHEGIVWYLRRFRPGVRIVTVTTVNQEKVETLDKENLNKADIVLCVPDDMTRTHARSGMDGK